MKKNLIYMLLSLFVGGCATTNKITQNTSAREGIKKDTPYTLAFPLPSFNPLDTLKGPEAYLRAKKFFENAERFYEEGVEDSSKFYFEEGTRLLSQSNLSLEDHNFIDLRRSINNLEQYKTQKEAIENGIEISEEEVENVEKKFPMGKRFAERVAYYEKYFKTKREDWFKKTLERFLQYSPYLDSLSEEKNIPKIVNYMYPIESGMDMFAKSWIGAKGIPQFMEQTGKKYGLKILGLWYDERLDPIKAIPASMDYINYLISDFIDPNLAIAGYNCGERRVITQLKKFSAFDFDELFEKKVLPKETLEHLSQIYAFKDLSETIGIKNPKKDPILENLLTGNFDIITLEKQTSFKTIARIIGISKNELKAYNPAYGFDATPPERMIKEKYSFEIRIPKGTKEKFGEKISKIKEKYKFEGGSYIVKNGDTLWEISKMFKVPLYELKKVNGFPKIIKPSQRLIIPGEN